MEASTPIRQHKDLRRSILLNNSFSKVSSPLRKSLGKSVGSPVVVLERANEEEERDKRRSAVAMRRRLTSVGSSLGGSFSELGTAINENQIRDHLKICTRLFTENKITTQNAWELHIIDVIRKITTTEDDGSVLQVAGSSLDIGVKVYSLRVDDVHSRGLQLASTMAKSNEAPANEDQDGNDNELDGTQAVRQQTRKRKRNKLGGDKKNTVDADGKNLFAPLTEIESALFSTTENIEISATENLFSSKLHSNPATHQVMLMSAEKVWTTASDILKKNSNLLEIELDNVTDFATCASLKDFELCEWDPDEEEKQLLNGSVIQNAVLDENGIPIAELDGSTHDIFQDINNDNDGGASDEEEYHDDFQVQIHGGVVPIVDAIPEESRTETDYGYNAVIRSSSGKYLERIWAGPSHWKIKFIRRSTARFSGATTQVVKHTRRPKVFEPIDFDREPRKLPENNKMPVKRNPGTVPDEKVTLPTPESCTSLFHESDHLMSKKLVRLPKPKVPLSQNGANNQECEVPAYNYDNLNDSQYCSQNNMDEPAADNSFEHDEEAPAAMQNFLSENLVEAPELVSSSQMTYAMQAKKMDMKKLKAAVWKQLTSNNDNVGGSEVRPMDFSKMYQDLPRYLSADMKKELTCPLAFVALLHLCNENTLKLDQYTDFKDFKIFKAEQMI